MKKLHLVGLTPDNDGLLLSVRKGSKTGGYVVTLDDETLAAIERARRQAEGGELGDDETDEAAAPPARARARSSLTPREIQARLRAGSTIAEVANAAGVGEEWVQRFAAPILAEQEQVVERAQSMTFGKARLGPSIEPLAASVQWNLSDRGVRFSDDVFADCWSAYNLHGARWAVRFSYFTRKRHQVAEWEVDLRDQRITARNRLAADLAHVETGRRPPEPESAEPNAVAAPPVISPPAASKAPARATPAKAAAKTAAGKRTSGRSAVARTAGPIAPDVAGVVAPAAGRAKATAAKTAAKGAAKTAGRRGAGKTAARVPLAPAAPDATTPSPGESVAPARASKKGAARGAASVAKASVPRKAAARTAPRESSPRKARAAKKPPADAPGGTPAAEPLDERPSHLARPPSPMKTANRVTSTPVPRYARPSPPRPRPTPPAPPPRTAPPAPEPLAVAESPAPADVAAGPSPAEPAAPERRATPPARAAAAGKAAAPPPDQAAAPAGEERLITVPASRPPAVKAARATKSPRTPPVAPPIRRAPTDEPVVAATGVDGPAVVILPTPRPGAAPPRGRGAAAAATPPASAPPAFEDGDDDAAWSTFTSPEAPAGTGAASGRGGTRRPRR